jgi:hypothetical protein
MKDRLGRCVVVGLLAAAFAASASAEGLGEAAKRERERRAKLEAERAAKGEKPAKTYSEADVQNARGENFSQATGPVSNSSTYVPSSSTPVLGRGGSAGKQPTASGGSVSALEQRVSDLERQRASLPPGPFGPSVACVEGAHAGSGRTAIQMKNSPTTRVCDPNAVREQEAQRVQAQLDQARAALEQARR